MDLDKALEIFGHAKDAGLVDVVSYNTLIKGQVAKGDLSAAQDLLEEISKCGFRPTHASYHTILNFHSSAGDIAAVWKIFEKMQINGVPPNSVTCSIALKGKMTSSSDVDRVLKVMSNLDDPMDEVLFSAFAESCIRTKKLDVLTRQMSKSHKQKNRNSSPLLLMAP